MRTHAIVACLLSLSFLCHSSADQKNVSQAEPGYSSTSPDSCFVPTNGKRLRIVTPGNDKSSEWIGVGIRHENWNEFSIAIFSAAVERLSYNITIEKTIFGPQNGSYNDLLYQVYLQNFDAAVGDITITSNRSNYVEFTVPFTEPGVGTLVKQDDHRDPWFFLKPLDANLWLTTACFFLLTGFIVWLIEHRVNEEFQGPPAQQIGTALWFAVSTLVYAHRERLKSNVSRFVVGLWLLVVLILTSSYTAKLSSLLTIEQIQLRKYDYIGYPDDNALGRALANNLNFMDNRLKRFLSPEDYDKALRQGSKRGGVGAIIDELPYLRLFVARYPHDYAIIERSMITSGFGFAFPKGSPLVNDISRAICELREEGELLRMEKEWFSSQTSLLYEDTEPPDKPSTLGIYNFLGLFLLSGIVNSIAMFIFLIFLLREKLSIFYYNFSVLARGKLIFILRHLYARIVRIDEVNTIEMV